MIIQLIFYLFRYSKSLIKLPSSHMQADRFIQYSYNENGLYNGSSAQIGQTLLELVNGLGCHLNSLIYTVQQQPQAHVWSE